MTPISIMQERSVQGLPCYLAIAGKHRSTGRTAGEALDALLAQEGAHVESSTVLIHRFAPDSYFTQGQYDRLQALLARRSSLSSEESEELDALIDAELDATVARTDALAKRT